MIDIGANNHIYTNKAFFTDYYAYRPDDILYLWFIAAPGGSAKAEGHRTVKIGILVLDSKINEISFRSVYTLGNRFSIYSAYKGRRDLGIAYNDIDYKLYDKETITPIGYAYFNNGLPFIRQTTGYKRGISFVAITPEIAHRRLAHTSHPKRKTNQSMLEEEIIDNTDLFNYKAYRSTKSKQIISRTPQVRAERASDMLYADT